jgi:tetratricopeptide (TPR) repeat protein
MTPERWQEVKKVLASALELKPEERRVYLDQACPELDLRREVESLLAAHEQGDSSFMDQPVDANPTLEKGAQLGQYKIFARIGAGGMGEVYRARDTRLSRDVAIKVLPSFLSNDPDRLRRFEQEARAAAALNHPNILAVHQMGTYEGAPYLVSELLEGATLREHLKRGPIPLRKVIDCGVQVAGGLAAAHEKGIVHRDLKPENLFVTKDGRMKILDFGLAKLTETKWPVDSKAPTVSRVTEPGVVMGTVGYMAPEQVSGKPVDHRADVFALGAVLYEMLTGKRAFQKATSVETLNAILHEDPPGVSQLVSTTPPALQKVVQRCLEKDPEQRFQSASDLAFALEALLDSTSATAAAIGRPASRRSGLRAAAAVTIVLAALVVGGYFYFHRTLLTEKDSIVVADFANTTGDPVFDDTLRQGLSVQLEQSPFFTIVSGDRITQTLGLMEQPRDARLTPALARQLCERVSAKAVIEGSIASLDNQYILGLNAVDCQTGEALAQEQVTADGKTKVLAALTTAASELRSRLGESRASLETYNVPLVQATTSSLEALQTYSRCDREFYQSDLATAIQSCEHAVSLDPGFAAPHALLSNLYAFRGDSNLASENARKAYELRDRASEWEKLFISGLYHIWYTGDFEKAADASLLWAQTYPLDQRAFSQLDYNYRVLGRYEQALAASLEAVRLDPTRSQSYVEVATDQVLLNRLEEARATIQGAQARSLQSLYFPDMLYWIAFLLNDAAGMGKQESDLPAIDKPYVEIGMATHAGRLSHARDLTQGAIASATRANAMEAAAALGATSALTEALFGNLTGARSAAMRATSMSADWDSREMSALALALAGELPEANNLSADLNRRFPERTCVQFDYLPAIHAAVALRQGGPEEAIAALRAASPYELSFLWPARSPAMMPAYVRGEAYLAAHRGAQAAAEFQRILDHQSVFFFSAPIGVLARLQLGRAYGMQGDTAKAKTAYQDFLALWKDADPDIPILKQAKAEYARLQ